jgi:DNA-binding GntR family transcriptional regulator
MTSAGAAFHEELIRMSENPMFLFALERANQLRRLIEYRLKVDPQRIVARAPSTCRCSICSNAATIWKRRISCAAISAARWP